MPTDPKTIQALVGKYDLSGPRYTSYPTVPAWQNTFTGTDYQAALTRFSDNPEPLSIYVHIPFCNSRCLYCGCNVVIRKHAPEAADPYLDSLLGELKLVTDKLPERQKVLQFHIGGGTPNYLTLEQTKRLFDAFYEAFDFDKNAEISIEVDPRYLTPEMLTLLHQLGVNRISMGIQDFDERVQKAVNRVQPFAQVKSVVELGRKLGFQSINMDLIYGLPFQTDETIAHTIRQVLELRPDRIAFYSYAHIPSQIPHQKVLDQFPIPEGEEKLRLFLNGRAQLLNAGYDAIAMDHFALPTDELSIAFTNRKLYRNFMGYTTQPAFQYLGFGVSSIGYFGGAFAQNEKEMAMYMSQIEQGNLPISKGITLQPDDKIRQWVIGQIMCHFEVKKSEFEERFAAKFDVYFESEISLLDSFFEDQLLVNKDDALLVLEAGQFFVRNIAMVFDVYLGKKPNQFSRTV